MFMQEEYRACITSGQWHRQVPLPDGDKVMIHSPRAIIHYVGAGLEGEFPTAVSVNVSDCHHHLLSISCATFSCFVINRYVSICCVFITTRGRRHHSPCAEEQKTLR